MCFWIQSPVEGNQLLGPQPLECGFNHVFRQKMHSISKMYQKIRRKEVKSWYSSLIKCNLNYCRPAKKFFLASFCPNTTKICDQTILFLCEHTYLLSLTIEQPLQILRKQSSLFLCCCFVLIMMMINRCYHWTRSATDRKQKNFIRSSTNSDFIMFSSTNWLLSVKLMVKLRC